MKNSTEDQLQPSQKQRAPDDGVPKFGRLLLVLLFGVLMIVAITYASEAFYSR